MNNIRGFRSKKALRQQFPNDSIAQVRVMWATGAEIASEGPVTQEQVHALLEAIGLRDEPPVATYEAGFHDGENAGYAKGIVAGKVLATEERDRPRSDPERLTRRAMATPTDWTPVWIAIDAYVVACGGMASPATRERPSAAVIDAIDSVKDAIVRFLP